MPYTVKKVGNKFKIIKKSTGKTVGSSDSKEMAVKSIQARYANEKK